MSSPAPARVLFSLGANLGAPLEQFRLAIARLRDFVVIDAVSPVYRGEPIDAPSQPDYYNLACRGWTTLPPHALLTATQEIETELGRDRAYRYAPRLIDIDLLAYDDLVIDTAELTLPHPRAAERRFVLTPLHDIAPEWRHPVLGLTTAELLQRGDAVGAVERLGPLETL